MKFEELDQRMRMFEAVNDRIIMPEMYMVARIDGRGFTKLTKERYDFEKPFDERFHDYMIATVMHLMHCGFNITYLAPRIKMNCCSPMASITTTYPPGKKEVPAYTGKIRR